MSISLKPIVIKNGENIFWQGIVGSMSFGEHTQFDVAREILGRVKSDPDVRAMLDSGWTEIQFKWLDISYAIKNNPEGLSVEQI